MMEDSEIKDEVLDEAASSEQETVQEDSQGKGKAKKKNGYWAGLKSEFKRIVWPDKDSVIKESVAVIVTTVVLGIVIAVLDWAIQLGLDRIIG
jgi:preprotein translocase subunit SecE